MKRYAVFGSPVAHSQSPRIHAAFARQTGIAMDYGAIETGADRLAVALADSGVHGANITLPLKEAAFALCRTVSDRARRAGAVNTLVRTGPAASAMGEGWHGDNTDGAGLVRDLTARHGLDLRERRVLLLGAGGAARGVAPALLEAGIAALFVVNRTPERAVALMDAMAEPARVHAREWGALAQLGSFDLVINATSAGRTGAMPDLPMALASTRSAAVDLSYGDAAVPFLAWARAAGFQQAIDGLGMLVEQAAESFMLWHGVRPETDAVFASLARRDDALVTAD